MVRKPSWVSVDEVFTDDDWTPEEVEKTKNMPFPEWHLDALCRNVENPDDMFFGESEDQTRTTMTITKIKQVKKFCRSCPVFETCLTHALSYPEKYGIWAGTSRRTRLRIFSMVDAGSTTVETVISDYLNGREKKYESVRCT